MLADLQCWHECNFCGLDHYHVIANAEMPIDPWKRPCDQCVAAGKVPQIIPREQRAVPEVSAAEGREEPPASVEGQGLEKIIPETPPTNEEVRPEPVGEEGMSRSLAYSARDDFELLRVLFEREVSAETI